MGRRSGGSPGNKGFESEVATLPGVPAEEGRDFMAIAADSHGTPAATMRAGIVVKEESAGGIRAAANGRFGAFDEEFCGGTSYRCQQPVETAFPGDKLQGPRTLLWDQFIMSFSDAQDLIDRLDPGGWNWPLLDHRRKNRA